MANKIEKKILCTVVAIVFGLHQVQGLCTAVANPAVYEAWCNAYPEAHCNPSFVGNLCEWTVADQNTGSQGTGEDNQFVDCASRFADAVDAKIGSDGSIFVVEDSLQTVKRVAPQCGQVTTLLDSSDGLIRPSSVAYQDDGSGYILYVSNSQGNSGHKFVFEEKSSSDPSSQIALAPTNQFLSYLYFDYSDNTLYGVDGNKNVGRYSNDLQIWHQFPTITAIVDMRNIIKGCGRFYIAADDNNQIFECTDIEDPSTCGPICTGSYNGVTNPWAVAVGNDCSIYTASRGPGAGKIVKYDADNCFQETELDHLGNGGQGIKAIIPFFEGDFSGCTGVTESTDCPNECEDTPGECVVIPGYEPYEAYCTDEESCIIFGEFCYWDTCVEVVCPHLECPIGSDSVVPEGECCPICVEDPCALVLCPLIECPFGSHIPEGECCAVCNIDPCAHVRCPHIECPFGSHVPKGECCPICNVDPCKWTICPLIKCPFGSHVPEGECCPVCNEDPCKEVGCEKILCPFGSHIPEGKCCPVCNPECEKACPLIKCPFGSHVPEGECCPVCNEDPCKELEVACEKILCPFGSYIPEGKCCPVCKPECEKACPLIKCPFGSHVPEGECCAVCNEDPCKEVVCHLIKCTHGSHIPEGKCCPVCNDPPDTTATFTTATTITKETKETLTLTTQETITKGTITKGTITATHTKEYETLATITKATLQAKETA
eukprot:Awhi_evm1s5499